MEMMMSSQDSAHGPAARYHYYGHGDHDDNGAGFLEMFGDLHSSSGSGDLFELVWQGGAEPAARSCCATTEGGGGDCSLTSSLPPSEDEMASWLRPIFVGDGDHAAEDDDQPVAAPAMEAKTKTTEAKSTVDTVINCSQRRKQRGRRSHHSGTHHLTEKRRRWKINEKFKTLQQLVPGCDNKSNQTSTLEQTIKHMKSLQHQIQAMSFGCRIIEPPASSAAVYPVIMLPPYYLPPSPAVAGAPPLSLPPAAFAPGVLMSGGHVWPEEVLAPPPPAMSSLPFAAATLPLPTMMAQQDPPRR